MQHFPTPSTLKTKLPAGSSLLDNVEDARKQIKSILSGKDHRWLAIVGPCSIHDTTAALEYAIKLRDLSEKISDSFFVVMRTYYEKSRTSMGWKGMVYDPNLDGSLNIYEGIQNVRKFLLDIVSLNIPTAAEILDPLTYPYFTDLISWGCIGARTSTSQIHRQIASHLKMPVGIKNSTDGNIDNAVNGVLAAISSHRFLGVNEDGKLVMHLAQGNPNAHVVLRGSDSSGIYDPTSLNYALEKLQHAGLPGRFIVDCSHGNSQRVPFRQIEVLKSLLQANEEGNSHICGIILESFLKYGQQEVKPFSQLKYGISITDPCLGWEETEAILLEAHERLSCGVGIAVK